MVGRLYEWQLPLERRAPAAAAELAAVEPGERLLDVATGTGGLPRALAARGARPREAVALDRSTSMLAVAAARLPPDWSLRRGDAKHLPFPDQSFDLVSACYLLHLLGPEDRIQVLTEIARVLRPGGRVVTITTDSRRPVARKLLERLPRSSGLRALDPAREFDAAGLRPLRARFVPSGWPSLCVLGERPSNA
jgi:demethylmenaquinone methyltransferase / 2-methoxy-6-polyprenyl-1,4-benzoquinol methylase